MSLLSIALGWLGARTLAIRLPADGVATACREVKTECWPSASAV
jgi:hypothetical protein